MLSLLLLIPIIGSLLLLTIPENSIENKIRMMLRLIACQTSSLHLGMAK